jgi:hypothetical protein
VDFDAYARMAVDLVNAPLDDLSSLKTVFPDPEWMCEEATERDLQAFRRAQKKLRDVFEHGSSGREHEAVNELNGLLENHPVHPRISGHQSGNWHIHVTSRGSMVSAEYLAGGAIPADLWRPKVAKIRWEGAVLKGDPPARCFSARRNHSFSAHQNC